MRSEQKKGAAVAIIAVVAVIGGLAAYSSMARQEEPGPAPVLTTIDRSDEPNESTTIAEDAQDQPPQGNGTVIANNTSIATGTSSEIAANGSSVYVIWSDEDEIFLATSADGGETFGERESLSNEGFWPKVAADESAYVAWTEDSDIMVAAQ